MEQTQNKISIYDIKEDLINIQSLCLNNEECEKLFNHIQNIVENQDDEHKNEVLTVIKEINDSIGCCENQEISGETFELLFDIHHLEELRKLSTFLKAVNEEDDWEYSFDQVVNSRYSPYEFFAENDFYQIDHLADLIDCNIKSKTLLDSNFFYLLPSFVKEYENSDDDTWVKVNAYVNDLESMKEYEVKDLYLEYLLECGIDKILDLD